jgi:AAA domain/Bifunctional DNA primase/polymerase, N-terminal
LQTGFHPLPLFGKAPSMMKNWPTKLDTNAAEIVMWGKQWPDARNTGILTKFVPTLDIDILNPEAVETIKRLVIERFEERGYTPCRTGQAPKCAFIFRCGTPFQKITADLIAPDGSQQHVELLCNGQQVVVDGEHPVTHTAYTWHGGCPGTVPRDALADISEDEAKKLIDNVATLLVEQFGYTHAGTRKKSEANGQDHGGGADWAVLIANPIDHDNLTALAAKVVIAGMSELPAIRLLRAMVMAVPEPVDPTRRTRRWDEIPGMVTSALAKFVHPEPQQAPETTEPGAPVARAFGFPWSLNWQGDAAMTDTRPCLVQDLLPETGAGLISGQWGTYKTFVAIDLAMSVITGFEFIRFPVRRRGGVLFIACEGQSEVAIRINAATSRHGLDKAAFCWTDTCPRLLDPNAAKILAAMVAHASEGMREKFDLPVALVIIDTAGRAAGYSKTGDENDAATAKAIMATLAAASAATGALFLGVAHFGKMVETGTRGSSSFEDDSDVVLALLADKATNGSVTRPRLCARKRRSGPNGEEFEFRPRVVNLGVDSHGSPITTLVIDWLSADEAAASPTQPDDKWTKGLRMLRQVLMTLLPDCGSDQRPYPDGPIVRAIDIELVRGEFYKG